MAKKVGIEIVVDNKGSIKSFRQLGKAGSEATGSITKGSVRANKSLLTLRNVGLAGVIAGTIKLAKSTIELVDTYSLLDSQIRLVIDDGNSLEKVQRLLLETSNETRLSFQATTKLYTRLDRATQQLFLTDEQVIKATNTLNKAIIISGASATEASAALTQLSQGLASGVLRGEELNSILEQTPRIAQLIADGLGKTIGALRQLGSQGKLTTEVIIDALNSQTDAIDKEFAKIEVTSAQTWTVLTNNAESYFVKLEEVNAVQSIFNSLLKVASAAFSNLDKAKTLEIAQKTEVENRSLEQQVLILADLNKQKEKSNQFDVAVQKNLSVAIKSAQIELELIQKRTTAQDALNKTKLEERKAAAASGQAKIERDALGELQAIADERNSIAEFKLREQVSTANAINQERINREVQEEIDKQDKIEGVIIAAEENRFLSELSGLERRNAIVDLEVEHRIEALEKLGASENELAAFTSELDATALNRKEDNAKKEEKIAQDAANFQMQLRLQTASLAVSALTEIFGENKAFALADIGINTARGVQRSFADLPPPFNFIQAGLIGASGVAQAAKVSSQKFANGGIVEGPGTNRSDSIPISVSPGEGILNQATVQRIGAETVEALNNGGGAGTTINIEINAGAGTDLDSLAQVVTNAVQRATQLGLEPSVA